MQALQITFDQLTSSSKTLLYNENELPSISRAVEILTKTPDNISKETTTIKRENITEETPESRTQDSIEPSISEKPDDIFSETPIEEINDIQLPVQIPVQNNLPEENLQTTTPEETKTKDTLFNRMQKQHDLIDGKTNEEAIQALIDHLDTAKEVTDTKNMAVMTLPPGLFVSFTISGSTFATSRENENDFVEKIKMALPKELRGAGNRLRTVIDRELEMYSIRVFNGIRYVPAKNFAKVQKFLVDAESNGVGKDKKYSVQKIREDMWEHRDEINKNAEDLNINAKIESVDDLKKKICLTSFFIDTTFGSTELDPALVSKVVEQKTQHVLDQTINVLTKDIENIIRKLSTQIANANKSKNGKINSKSASAMQKQISRIRSLNPVVNPEIDNLLNAAEGLILRNKDAPVPITSTSKKQGSIRKKSNLSDVNITKDENNASISMPQAKPLSTPPTQTKANKHEKSEQNIWIEELSI